MATTKTTAATATATAKAAPAPTPATPAKAETVAVAPQAPLFTVYSYNPTTAKGWPVKAQGGNTVRAYCYQVAVALAKAQPNGFTLAQYASALAANAAGSTMRQPGNGWGTAAQPNGIARQHAAWFAAAAQQWLVAL